MQSANKRQGVIALARKCPLASAVLLYTAFVLPAHLVDANSYVSLESVQLEPAESLRCLKLGAG